MAIVGRFIARFTPGAVFESKKDFQTELRRLSIHYANKPNEQDKSRQALVKQYENKQRLDEVVSWAASAAQNIAEDLSYRIQAIHILRDISSQHLKSEIVDNLLKLSEDFDHRIRTNVVEALGAHKKYSRVTLALIKYLNDKDFSVRATTVDVLGQTDDGDAIKALEEIRKDGGLPKDKVDIAVKNIEGKIAIKLIESLDLIGRTEESEQGEFRQAIVRNYSNAYGEARIKNMLAKIAVADSLLVRKSVTLEAMYVLETMLGDPGKAFYAMREAKEKGEELGIVSQLDPSGRFAMVRSLYSVP